MNDHNDKLPVLFLALLAGFFLWLWWLARVRAKEIRALAASLNFKYLGEALPRSLQLNGAPLDSVTAAWNVVDGEPRGTRVIAFDCKFGEGKGSWRRTVIAIQTEISNIKVSAFDPRATIEQIGNWVVVWRPKEFTLIPSGLMSVTELRAHLETL